MQAGALPPAMCRIVQELQSDAGERIMWISMSLRWYSQLSPAWAWHWETQKIICALIKKHRIAL